MQKLSPLRYPLNLDLLSPIDKLVYFLSLIAALFDPKSRLTQISETLIEDTVYNLLPDLISLINTDKIESLFPKNKELSVILQIIKNLNPKLISKNDSLNYLSEAILKDFPFQKSTPLSEKQIAQSLRLLAAKLILENYQDSSFSEQLEILNQYLAKNYYQTDIHQKIIAAWNQYQQNQSSNLSNHIDFLFDTFFHETTNLGLSVLGQTCDFSETNNNAVDAYIDFFQTLFI